MRDVLDNRSDEFEGRGQGLHIENVDFGLFDCVTYVDCADPFCHARGHYPAYVHVFHGFLVMK